MAEIIHNTSSDTTTLQADIIKTLLYFDVFDYPLTSREINSNCPQPSTIEEIEKNLEALVKEGLIIKNENLYYSGADKNVFNKRKEGNLLANKTLSIANRFSKLIASFPFVRGVYLSGSLSKGFMDKDSDVDYFIITSPQRLWLCRTLLVAFKKIMLFNSKKYFCVNYFIDTESLEIQDKNLFTATELTSIYPTYNYDLYKQFLDANSWTKKYFPNKNFRPDKTLKNNQFSLKNGLEKMLNGKLGERLDNWCFNFTLKHWQKKFPDFDTEQFDLRLRSRKNVSKHHPHGYQTKVLKAYKKKLIDFENQHHFDLAATANE